jgi:drug/metabolite transporter (DMT)-like permease
LSADRVLLVIIGIAIISVIGDYFLKLASLEPHAVQNRLFLVGCVIYMLSALGWVYIMRHIKLGPLGVIYSLSISILLTALGVLVFGETLNRYELAGFGFGLLAIVLLGRFGG